MLNHFEKSKIRIGKFMNKALNFAYEGLKSVPSTRPAYPKWEFDASYLHFMFLCLDLYKLLMYNLLKFETNMFLCLDLYKLLMYNLPKFETSMTYPNSRQIWFIWLFMVSATTCYVNSKQRIGFICYVTVTELAVLIKQLSCISQ